ncbi:MAG: nuclear transport factor 2 family protein [Gammaproteobacteria bacterium]|nr:nuclear transport factor 2 family protein [Gammaproteobacteria bacterium]
MNNIIGNFQKIYGNLNAGNIESVNTIYEENITFIDPFHEIRGLSRLRDYFSKLYKNVESCEFNFEDVYEKPRSAMITWNMTLRHRTLSRNNPIEVSGSTQIRFDDRIYFHRDYFDAGRMVYENLPLIGPLLKYIKQKV